MDTPFLVFSCWLHVCLSLCAVSLCFCLRHTLSFSLSSCQFLLLSHTLSFACSFSTLCVFLARSLNHFLSLKCLHFSVVEPLKVKTVSWFFAQSIPVSCLSFLLLFFPPFLTFFFFTSLLFHPCHSLSLSLYFTLKADLAPWKMVRQMNTLIEPAFLLIVEQRAHTLMYGEWLEYWVWSRRCKLTLNFSLYSCSDLSFIFMPLVRW